MNWEIMKMKCSKCGIRKDIDKVTNRVNYKDKTFVCKKCDHKKILWLSRHSPLHEQIKNLKKGFDVTNIEIVQISLTFSNVEEIIDLFIENNCDEVVAVLPVNLIAGLVKRGIQPLRSIMKRELNGDSAKFTHRYFERIIKFNIETKRI